jgi:hypothetical protein
MLLISKMSCVMIVNKKDGEQLIAFDIPIWS